MKAKIGIVLMILGSVLVSLALGLFLYNAYEQKQAADAVNMVMPQLVETIHDRRENQPDASAPMEGSTQSSLSQSQKTKMPVVEIDGYPYIGFVSIPALNLELPVMDNWSYSKLKQSPCRFTGDMYSDDLVVMAHNYDRHFGALNNLRVGDSVTFTDMDGTTLQYAVAAVDVLHPTAVEEMTAGEYDLTLFTCTYSGQSRVTIRCDRTDG